LPGTPAAEKKSWHANLQAAILDQSHEIRQIVLRPVIMTSPEAKSSVCIMHIISICTASESVYEDDKGCCSAQFQSCKKLSNEPELTITVRTVVQPTSSSGIESVTNFGYKNACLTRAAGVMIED